MFCYFYQKRIATERANTPPMAKTPINELLAANLRLHMTNGPLKTQAALADKAGVAQRTIGNYLSPSLRTEGSKGKAPSAKLSELEKIADALGIQVWELLKPTNAEDLIIQRKVEEAIREIRSLDPNADHPVHTLHEPRKHYGR